MVDAGAVSDIFSLTSAAWSGVLVLGIIAWRLWNGLPAVMAQWVAWRQAKLAAQLAREKAINEAKDTDWTRLRDEVGRLSGRVETLEREVAACHDREFEWMSRALRAEAINQGQGEVRQAAAAASAEVRLDARDKSDAAKKKSDG